MKIEFLRPEDREDFSVTLESPVIPRIGETVTLPEGNGERFTSYEVDEVVYDWVDGQLEILIHLQLPS